MWPACLQWKHCSVHGKIMEKKILGESLATAEAIGEVICDESASSLSVIPLNYIYCGGKFGKLYTIYQISQKIPPSKFSHAQYLILDTPQCGQY